MTPLDALSRIDRARAQIARAMAFERIAPALRIIALILTVIGVAGLLGVWRSAHPLMHALAGLAGFALAGAGIWFTVRTYRTPTQAEINRRLAKTSDDTAVLDGLDDRPAGGDVLAHAVWREHQQRLADRAEKIKGGHNHFWRGLDPWNIRWVILVLLIGTGIYAGRDAPARLAEAYKPPWGALLGDGRLTFDVWATPPAYTGQSPIYLAGRASTGGTLPPTPEGSTISVRIFGAKGAPLLILRSSDGVQRIRFVEAGGGFEAKTTITADTRLEVHRFGKRAYWHVRVIDDTAPKALFVSNPKIDKDGRVSFTWRATDDFGIQKVWLAVRLTDPTPGPETSNRDEIVLAISTTNSTSLQASERLDLFAHQFAGLKVKARIIAADGLGQRGESALFTLILPEQRFTNPLALAIIEARRVLLRERRPYDSKALRLFDDHLVRISRAPDGIKRAAKLVEAITLEPVQFFKDASIFLGLKFGLSQINTAKTTPDAHQAGGTLWAVAMKVEYGVLQEAMQKLAAAKDALKQTIENGADGDTIDKLARDLKEAIEGAIEASIGMTASGEAPKSPEERAAEMKEAEMQIEQLIEEIKSAAKRNDKGEAQKALDKLGQKTDEMTAQNGNPGEQEQAGENGEPGSGQQQDGKGSEQQSREALEQLGQAMDEQKSLADQTFQKAQDGGGAGGDAMAKEQGEIAGKLAQAAGKAGDKPGSQSLEQAGKAMKDAEQALAKGDYGKAMGLQAQAINKMREGAAALASSLKGAGSKGQTGQNADPLGRQPGSGQDGGKGVTVPDYAERQRSQEILDEIKRRAARVDSDPVERSYLERLLERF
jgi:uncharacterized protein (TIGR02302 family)